MKGVDVLMTPTMKIFRIPLESGAKVPMPQYSSEGAACFDLYSANTETLVIPPKTLVPVKVPLGIKVQVPDGWELKLYSRSGMSSKGILSVVQGTGHIDSDYRGEVCALVYNSTANGYAIEPFSRICQGKIEPAPQYGLEEVNSVEDLSTTARGEGGFGSTGQTDDAETVKEQDTGIAISEEMLKSKTVLELKKIADTVGADRTGLSKKAELIAAIMKEVSSGEETSE